jgi:hypothetical protein
MTKNLTQAAITAVIGGALALSPTRAEDPAKVDEALKKQIETSNKQIEENNKLLTDVQKQLKEFREQQARDMKELQEKVFGRKDERGFPVPSDPGIASTVRQLSDEVAKLNKQVESISKQYQTLKPPPSTTTIGIGGSPTPPPPPSTSALPGTMPPAPGAVAGRGTLRIINEYPVEISMQINEKGSYKVAPKTEIKVDVPAGDFSYLLLQSGGQPVKSQIKDKETVTLRIK